MMGSDETRELFERLSRIEARLDGIDRRLATFPEPGEAFACRMERENFAGLRVEIEALKTAIGKRSVIALVLGAVGGLIILAIKVFATKGG